MEMNFLPFSNRMERCMFILPEHVKISDWRGVVNLLVSSGMRFSNKDCYRSLSRRKVERR